MKIEFDENNPLLVAVVTTMMNTLNNSSTELTTHPITEEGFAMNTVTDFEKNTGYTPKPTTEATTDDTNVGIEVDANGFTHDSRIHARTKTKNADGTWKILRRPQSFETAEEWEAFIAEVRAEQSGELPPPVIEAEEVPPPNDFGTKSEELPPPVIEAEEEKDITFAILMKTVTGSGGKVSAEDLQEICEGYELKSSVELSKPVNRILIPAIYDEVMDIINA